MTPLKSFSDLGRYRIEFDESLKHDPKIDRDSKVWYEQVPIRGKGYIYLKSTTECAAYVPSMGILNKMITALEDAQLPHQVERLDGEGVIYFSLENFKAVAKILGAKMKRPKPKPEVMEKGIEALKSYRLANVQSELDGQI